MTEQPGAGGKPRRRFALLLEYDGARFAGSQLQENARTVQGVVEAAVLKATGESSRIALAGRTDAGVHAAGQVAVFDTATRLDTATLQRALNAWLPEDVAVRDIAEVARDFDPRRHARRRHYRYVIDNGPVRPVLERDRVWHVPGELDVESMSRAAGALAGTHDFAAFGSRLEDPTASTVRELYCFTVAAREGRIEIDVEANAFLPHQVRRMVGALVEVGRGRLSPEAHAALLAGPSGSAGPAAPAHGLYLVKVEYAEAVFSRESGSTESK